MADLPHDPTQRFTLADEAGVFTFHHWYRNRDDTFAIIAIGPAGDWRAVEPSRIARILPRDK